jgi:hypothetical protein
MMDQEKWSKTWTFSEEIGGHRFHVFVVSFTGSLFAWVGDERATIEAMTASTIDSATWMFSHFPLDGSEEQATKQLAQKTGRVVFIGWGVGTEEDPIFRSKAEEQLKRHIIECVEEQEKAHEMQEKREE